MSDIDITAEVHDLCARRDIYDAVCRYMRGQDRLMPDVQRSAFHDDAYVDCGLFAGDAAAFVDFTQSFLRDVKSSHHLIGQVQIKVDGRVAYGEVYFTCWLRVLESGVERDMIISGRYVDEYQDRGSGWKIAKRRELVDWARTDAPSDSFIRETKGLILGARLTQDFSNQRNWPA